MKRKNNPRAGARCRLVEMVIDAQDRIIDVTKEVLDQFERLDGSERIVVVAYLQVFRREIVLVDKTQVFEFFVDTDRKVLGSDLFLLHKWLELIVSKCHNPKCLASTQIKEEICVALFCEKVLMFSSNGPNKKRRR